MEAASQRFEAFLVQTALLCDPKLQVTLPCSHFQSEENILPLMNIGATRVHFQQDLLVYLKHSTHSFFWWHLWQEKTLKLQMKVFLNYYSQRQLLITSEVRMTLAKNIKKKNQQASNLDHNIVLMKKTPSAYLLSQIRQQRKFLLFDTQKLYKWRFQRWSWEHLSQNVQNEESNHLHWTHHCRFIITWCQIYRYCLYKNRISNFGFSEEIKFTSDWDI